MSASKSISLTTVKTAKKFIKAILQFHFKGNKWKGRKEPSRMQSVHFILDGFSCSTVRRLKEPPSDKPLHALNLLFMVYAVEIDFAAAYI